MKTGVVIYLCNVDNVPDDFDLDSALSRLNIAADFIEVASNKFGHFSPMDAWRDLIIKGAKRVILRTGQIEGDEIKLSNRELQLFGVV